jgi:hypothetical protein
MAAFGIIILAVILLRCQKAQRNFGAQSLREIATEIAAF